MNPLDLLKSNSLLLTFTIISLSTYFIIEAIKTIVRGSDGRRRIPWFEEVVLPLLPLGIGATIGFHLHTPELPGLLPNILLGLVAAELSGVVYRVVRKLIGIATGTSTSSSKPPSLNNQETTPTIPAPPRVPKIG